MPKLSTTQQKFILHWGEMGTRWGVNRTVAQIHALLFLANEPLTAEDIAETLAVARSNVSNSLKELQSWGLVKVGHVMGDRRDHFTALQDVWEIFRVILEERKRREIDPTIALLGELAEKLEGRRNVPEHVRERIGRMHQFIGTLTSWYEDIRRVPKPTLVALMKLGAKVARYVPVRGGTRSQD